MEEESLQTPQRGIHESSHPFRFSGRSLGIAVAVIIFLLLGSFVLGVRYQEKKVSAPVPTLSPSFISPSPTNRPTPNVTQSRSYISCETDADCPELNCGAGCTDTEPCPPCGFMQCIKNRCIRKYNGVDGTPVTLPWESSICGNGKCEACEGSDACCNYPCTRDTLTGNEYCPPPTCEGQCAQDCEATTAVPTTSTNTNQLPIPNVFECTTQSDCQEGYYCQNGICIEGAPNAIGKCQTTSYLSNHTCPSGYYDFGIPLQCVVLGCEPDIQ